MARADIIENIAKNEPLAEEYVTGRGTTNQTIVRSTAAPLDATEIFFNELSARAYANGTLTTERNRFQYGSRSYVGQHIAVVNKELSTATLYQIQNTTGDLKKLLTSSDINIEAIQGNQKIATITIDGKQFELSTISNDVDIQVDGSTIIKNNNNILSVGTILSSQVQNIENLKAEASSIVLNGYSTPTSGGQITSSDTLLSAIQKLEYQHSTINNFVLTSSLPDPPDPNTYYLILGEDNDTVLIA